MWPWGHLAVAYLLFVGYTEIRTDATQTAATVGAVVLGSQLPDLVDKTFAWAVPILPSGRSLGHSLVVVTICLLVLAWLVPRAYRKTVPAFGIGMVSHAIVDLGLGTVTGVLAGDFTELQWTTYLVWPLLAPPPYPNDESFSHHVQQLYAGPFQPFSVALFGLAVAVWIHSGAPGTAKLRQLSVRIVARTRS